MSKGEKTRQRMIDKTAELLQTQGYHATGLKQILAESNTPRGSLYFHFPGGKEALANAALQNAADATRQDIDALIAEVTNPLEALTRVLDHFTNQLIESDFKDGCPVATVALETAAHSDTLQRTCAEAYKGWETLIQARLVASGVPEEVAVISATAALSAIEGALLLSRAYRSTEPLERVGAFLALTLAGVS